MPSINLQCVFPIRRRVVPGFAQLDAIHPHEHGVFRIRSERFGVNASVKIDSATQAIWVMLPDVAVSEELLAWIALDSSHTAGQYPQVILDEVETLRREADAIARTVADRIKFFLGRTTIDDDTLEAWQNVLWGQPGRVAQSFPVPATGQLYMSSELDLSSFVQSELQRAFDNGYEPLMGERHLFRAYQETVARFRWIDATVAAELAIKEALVRKRPSLHRKIMSSRVEGWPRLYKAEMMEVFGEESPYYPAIKRGATKRNKLIHSTRDISVSDDEASDYLHQVALAIRSLYKLLYPDWELARFIPNMKRT